MGEERFADVTTDELIEEINRRSAAYVVGMIPKSEERDPKVTPAVFYSDGNLYAALGLAVQLQHDLIANRPFKESDPEG